MGQDYRASEFLIAVHNASVRGKGLGGGRVCPGCSRGLRLPLVRSPLVRFNPSRFLQIEFRMQAGEALEVSSKAHFEKD